MNFAAAILYAISTSVLLGIALGFSQGGLGRGSAIAALLGGLLVAVFSLWKARGSAPVRRPRGWEWFAVGLFAWFSVRAFLWLVTIEGDEIKTVVWNNCGDLSLHIGFIRYLANGAPFWPESPIFAGGKLSYSIGADLFNSLLVLLGIDVYRGLVLVGLVCSALAGVALWRWGRAFTMLGFLCNGGLAAAALLLPHHLAGAVMGSPVGFPDASQWPVLLDFQSNTAWKNIPLTMFITQRGFLYAIPAGLLLLCSWRARFFKGQGDDEWRMPVWGEVLLYASMPIFHIHTFIALSFMLAAFFLARVEIRKPLGVLVGAAFVPATILVWLTMGMLQSAPLPHWGDMSQFENPPPRPGAKVMGWNPGWMSGDDTTRAGYAAIGGDPEASSTLGRLGRFAYFWVLNFGILPILVIALCVVLFRMIFRRNFHIRTAMLWAFGAMLLSAMLSGWEFWERGVFFGEVENPGGITFSPMLAAIFAAIAGAMRPPSNGARMVRAALFGLAALFAIAASFPTASEVLDHFRVNALPLIAATVALFILLDRISRDEQRIAWPAVFVLPALYLFFLCCHVKFAPWEWDNTKIMIWAYLIVMPFLWDFVVAPMRFWTRVFVCELLFFSGFITLYGGLRPDMYGRTIASVSELQVVERAVKDIPITEPILVKPTHDHPVLLVGRRVALGYPGHIASHGHDPGPHERKTEAIMRGWGDWRMLSSMLGVRYLYWGRMENESYGGHDQPWRFTRRIYAAHDMELYDLDTPSVPLDDLPQ
jgi:hypothetical protein